MREKNEGKNEERDEWREGEERMKGGMNGKKEGEVGARKDRNEEKKY